MKSIETENPEDKLLFTPGPLTTSLSVKEASLRDLGSRDTEFVSLVKNIREKLLFLAHVGKPEYEAVIIQGSGTYGIEAVISSVIPSEGRLLNIINGAYGKRICQIAKTHSIALTDLAFEEDELPDIDKIEKCLAKDPSISHISVVHGETTTGILNPIKEIGVLAKKYGKAFIVDAMSTFGAIDVDQVKTNITYLVSSSNKCIEGIPGFSFIIAKKAELEKCKGNARTVSLDLFAQYEGLNTNGQFRFTPPVQSLLAFNEALDELEKEGGVEARASRYLKNNEILVRGMLELGFKLYLPDNIRSYIISSFLYPDDSNFSFEKFYNTLNRKGFVIYPGKLSKTDCFRIGNIGQIYPLDIFRLLKAIEETIFELRLNLNKRHNEI